MADDIKDEILDEEDDEIIEIEDETGEIQQYRMISDVEYGGKEYVMLQPCFETADPDLVLMFRMTYDDKGDIELYELESEEEEKAVFEEFKLVLGEEGYEFDE